MEQQQLTSELFVVDDLLDFSNHESQPDDGFDSFPDSSTVSSAANLSGDSSNSSSLYTDGDGTGFSDDLCVPCEDLAELEWLSNFVEESFSKEDQEKLHLLSGLKKPHQTTGLISKEDQEKLHLLSGLKEPHQTTGLIQTHQIKSEPELDQIYISTDGDEDDDGDDSNVAFPAKARSKRSRSAASTWASRLLAIAGSDETGPGPKKKQQRIKEHEIAGEIDGDGGEGRRCLHCATDKTPQWRTGPMGPKTLCNACGVRYKSGRLVPEYRPASSPTFVMARHSNSHRKVMELRRQKEIRDENLMSQLLRSNGGDYLIHNHHNSSHVAREFRHLI
ncbi:hypothetical protein AALP_AA7G192900 [Arabis alpina]|uniref:GATA transcription factor n=1 Tax=Arabis alpina TaxID=50452 RepID=A0A087GJ47_ARAAL|nr:hypothetical protein AALP_AA7G192900 [Arabis alpina]